MNNFDIKEIETERLYLRKLSVNDYFHMFNNWANDPIVTKYLGWYPHKDMNVTKEVLESWVLEYDKAKYYHYAITFKTNKEEVIGTIGQVGNRENDTIKIGYCISRKYWNQGLMSEALKGLIKYLFEEGIKEIIIECNRENIASSKVMLHNGLKYFSSHEEYSNKFNKVVTIDAYKIEAK